MTQSPRKCHIILDYSQSEKRPLLQSKKCKIEFVSFSHSSYSSLSLQCRTTGEKSPHHAGQLAYQTLLRAFLFSFFEALVSVQTQRLKIHSMFVPPMLYLYRLYVQKVHFSRRTIYIISRPEVLLNLARSTLSYHRSLLVNMTTCNFV